MNATDQFQIPSEFTRGFMCGLDSAVAAFESAIEQQTGLTWPVAIQLTALVTTAVELVREHVLGTKEPVQ